jgi:putative flippase GtrA
VQVNRRVADDLCVRAGTLPARDGDHREGPGRPEHRGKAAIIGPLSAYLRAHAVQLAHFVAVGASLAALNLLLLFFFRTRLHLSDPLAVTAMYTLGTVPHFVYHRWITYQAQDLPVVPQGLRYVVMSISNFVLMQALVGLAAWVSLSPYIAVMTSTGCTMVANFLMMTHVVFAHGRGKA